MTHASFSPAFNASRFYQDGTESGSTPLDAQDTNVTVDVSSGNVQVHLRVRVDETGGAGGATTDDWGLEFTSSIGGTNIPVTASSSRVQADTGSSLTDGSATTNRATNGISDPGSGSFVAGEQEEANGVVEDHQLTTNNFTEHVFALLLVAADLADGETLDFRLTLNGGNPGMTNNVTPRITVQKQISGTLAATEAADALAFTGTVVWPDINGTLAATETEDVPAFTGTVAWADINGTLGATEAEDAAALTGDVDIAGTLGAVEAEDVPAFTGNVIGPIDGTLGAVENPDVAALSGGVEVDGSLAANEPSDTAALAGGVEIDGALGVTEPEDLAAFTGTVVWPARSGTLGAVEAEDIAAFTGNIAGLIAINGSLGGIEEPDLASFSGGTVISGTVAAVEIGDTYVGAGTVEISGSIDATELEDDIDLTGAILLYGQLTAVEAADALAFSGTVTTEDITATFALVEGDDSPAFSGGVEISGSMTGAEGASLPEFEGEATTIGSNEMALIINDVAARVSYTATGGQTEFTIPFEFFDNTDLVVYKNGSLMTLDPTPADATEYSAEGAGSNGTKKITFGAGLTAGDEVVIYREVPLERLSDFPASGPFAINTLNSELDKLIALIQQRRDIDERSLRLAQDDPASSMNEMPDKTALANKVLGFDSNGDPIASTENLTDIEGAATSATAAAASAAAAAASEASAAADAAALADFVYGIPYLFDASTTMADPGPGNLRFNNATLASVTAIAIDDIANAVGSPDVSAWINSFDDSTNAIKGTFIVRKKAAPDTFALFNITGLTDNAGWSQLAVTYVAGGGSFSASDELDLQFARTGNDGAINNIVEDTTPQLGGALDGQGNDLNNMGVLFLTEQASAKPDVANKGQLWVRSSDNAVVYTGEGGTDLVIALGGTTAVGVGKHTFWLPIGAMTDDDGSPPLREIVVGTTSGQQVPVASFDAASTETLWFHVYMPKSWAGGTLTPILLWMPAGTSTGNCYWQVSATSFGDSDADAAMGSGASAIDAGAGTALDFQIHTGNALTISAAAAEEIVGFKVDRLGGSGSDTFTGDAHLIGVAFVYTTDQATDD